MTRWERFNRVTAMAPPAPEDALNFARLAPFEDSKACRCGSRNRVRNLNGNVSCQRCGRAHSRPDAEIRERTRRMQSGFGV